MYIFLYTPIQQNSYILTTLMNRIVDTSEVDACVFKGDIAIASAASLLERRLETKLGRGLGSLVCSKSVSISKLYLVADILVDKKMKYKTIPCVSNRNIFPNGTNSFQQEKCISKR